MSWAVCGSKLKENIGINWGIRVWERVRAREGVAIIGKDELIDCILEKREDVDLCECILIREREKGGGNENVLGRANRVLGRV